MGHGRGRNTAAIWREVSAEVGRDDARSSRSRQTVLVVAVLMFLPPSTRASRAISQSDAAGAPGRGRNDASMSAGQARPGDPVNAANPTLPSQRQTATTYPMLTGPPLRVALLHFRPRSRARPVVPFIAAYTSRAMATQPSLKAAEDFLSFVNNSPTRMLFLRLKQRPALTVNSLPRCQGVQGPAGEGGLQADQGELCPSPHPDRARQPAWELLYDLQIGQKRIGSGTK